MLKSKVKKLLQKRHPRVVKYSHDKKGAYPYYISPIEVRGKITYLEGHLKALGFDLQTDMK